MGCSDVVVGSGIANTVSVLLGNGAGSFPTVASLATLDTASGVRVGDFNGDGRIDVAAASAIASGVVAIYLGNGDGTLGGATTYAVGNTPRTLALADFDGDGTVDVTALNTGGSTLSLLRGTGTGTFAPATRAAHQRHAGPRRGPAISTAMGRPISPSAPPTACR